MVGIRPTITNSVVPMANALIVSAEKGKWHGAAPTRICDACKCRRCGLSQKPRAKQKTLTLSQESPRSAYAACVSSAFSRLTSAT